MFIPKRDKLGRFARLRSALDMGVRPGAKNYDHVSRMAEANARVANAKTVAAHEAALTNQTKVQRAIRSEKALAKTSGRRRRLAPLIGRFTSRG